MEFEQLVTPSSRSASTQELEGVAVHGARVSGLLTFLQGAIGANVSCKFEEKYETTTGVLIAVIAGGEGGGWIALDTAQFDTSRTFPLINLNSIRQIDILHHPTRDDFTLQSVLQQSDHPQIFKLESNTTEVQE